MSILAPTALSRPRGPDDVPGYRLEKLVGSGGMGEVHRAIQESLGRTVAVKVLAPELAREESFVTRFRKEAAALAALSHPHIVSIVDQGATPSGVPFLVMEFVDGPSLREVMRSPLFDAKSALRILHEVCKAIEYAHGRSVVHRDLKPENILFDEQAGGLAKVSDFGLASFLENEPTRFNLTQTHMSMGTLAYMAPEQRLDAKSADGRADIYSLGVILYEMLTGETPAGAFDPPSRHKPDVDARLDAIVARCLKPTPEDRYPTVAALLADLEPMLPESSVRPPPPPTAGQRVRLALARAGRVVVRTVALLVVLAAVGVLGVAAFRARQPSFVPASPDETLAAPLGEPVAASTHGRVDVGARGQLVTFHAAGPDLVPLLSFGRLASTEEGTLSFAAPHGESRQGRVVVDTVEVEGDALEWTATGRASSAPEDALAQARRLLYGPPPPAEAALVLSGDKGRFVALLVSEAGGHATLAWALGERRGHMRAPSGLSAGEGVRMELSLTREGELRAFLGAERNRRQVGEVLQLGEDWKRLFGRLPQPGFACLEGDCRFEAVRFQARRLPAPPPLAVPTVEATPAAATKKPAAVRPAVKRPAPVQRRRR